MDIINEFSSDHRIKIFNFQNHKGMAHARDFGIKQSAGDLIILHDSDEVIPPDYLHKMELALEHNRIVHPETVFQYGLDHKIRRYTNGIDYPNLPARGFHKSDYDEVGGFDLALGVYELGSFRNRLKSEGQHIEIVDTYVIDLGVHSLKQLFNRSYNLYKWKGILNRYWGGSAFKYHLTNLLLPLGLITSSPIKFVRTLGAIKGYWTRIK